MDLRKEYEKLYKHWLKEFQNTELTALNQENFNEFKKFLDFIKNYQEKEKNELKDRVLDSYKDNLNYLFKDFLRIREVKIINSALSLKEIDLNNVIEAEKLLYENLVSAIKGYKKVKAISLYEKDEIQHDTLAEPKVEIKSIIEEAAISREEKAKKISKSINKYSLQKIDYTLVRFLKKTPPLVGSDLINYGPFEKEDIAHLPQKNAKILIIEKFAEKIDIE
jgi:DNA replication initiation complex subunit (GINS family)